MLVVLLSQPPFIRQANRPHHRRSQWDLITSAERRCVQFLQDVGIDMAAQHDLPQCSVVGAALVDPFVQFEHSADLCTGQHRMSYGYWGFTKQYTLQNILFPTFGQS